MCHSKKGRSRERERKKTESFLHYYPFLSLILPISYASEPKKKTTKADRNVYRNLWRKDSFHRRCVVSACFRPEKRNRFDRSPSSEPYEEVKVSPSLAMGRNKKYGNFLHISLNIRKDFTLHDGKKENRWRVERESRLEASDVFVKLRHKAKCCVSFYLFRVESF